MGLFIFNQQIQNDQCQEMDSTSDKWVKLTDHGEWRSHLVSITLCGLASDIVSSSQISLDDDDVLII